MTVIRQAEGRFGRMGLMALAIVLAGGLTCPAQSAGRARGALFAEAQYFQWQEFGEAGDELLEETGPLFGIGGGLALPFSGRLTAEARGRLFAGEVDYDGMTIGGDPVQTTTRYVGMGAEGRLSLRLNEGAPVRFGPLAGLGGRWWVRDLEDAGPQARGYEETWLTVYAIVGASAEAPLDARHSLRAEAGLRIALDNSAEYDFSRLGVDADFSVEPGKRNTVFAEAEWRGGRFGLALFYEQLRFARSNFIRLGEDLVLYQPKSEADIVRPPRQRALLNAHPVREAGRGPILPRRTPSATVPAVSNGCGGQGGCANSAG